MKHVLWRHCHDRIQQLRLRRYHELPQLLLHPAGSTPDRQAAAAGVAKLWLLRRGRAATPSSASCPAASKMEQQQAHSVCRAEPSCLHAPYSCSVCLRGSSPRNMPQHRSTRCLKGSSPMLWAKPAAAALLLGDAIATACSPLLPLPLALREPPCRRSKTARHTRPSRQSATRSGLQHCTARHSTAQRSTEQQGAGGPAAALHTRPANPSVNTSAFSRPPAASAAGSPAPACLPRPPAH